MKNRYGIWFLVAISISALMLATAFYFIFFEEKKEDYSRPLCFSYCAKFEYAGEADGGYKVVTSEIYSLGSLVDSLLENAEELDSQFSEDWIYRITFDWRGLVLNGREIVVLVGENSMEIDGRNYDLGEEVDFAGVVRNFRDKYDYFDYELVYD